MTNSPMLCEYPTNSFSASCFLTKDVQIATLDVLKVSAENPKLIKSIRAIYQLFLSFA